MSQLDWESLFSRRMKRRGLIIGAGATAGLALAASQSRWVGAQPRFPDYPFKLGVASGEPLPDSVVIWTRLAPDPLKGGGMPDRPVPVQWQVATDETMSRVVRRGNFVARPELGHSVHVEVGGLDPNRYYWYQFKVGREISPVGRTKTAPIPSDQNNQFRFAFASCQAWQAGYYAAYRHMAEQELDLVVHLGDYIYEGGINPDAVRQHNSPEIYTLEDYRNRYALYKGDPNLQSAHAAFPWLVTFDDHEVDNNWADEIPQDPELQSKEAFLQRRAVAFQAYYEHMPLRRVSVPQGIDMQLYRRYTFGNLAEFDVLDTRQYRSDQACGEGIKPRCPEALDPSRTMTGAKQEQWLLEGLARSQAQWNVMAQQTIMAELDFQAGPGEAYNMDNWGGYVPARDRLLSFLGDRKPSNPVVITGDIHATFVNDLKLNFQDPNSPTVGTEFVGTSISTGKGNNDTIESALPDNPHIKFYNGRQRGYVLCDLNRERWQSDLLFVDEVENPNSPVRKLATYMVENGRPGAQRV